MVELKDPTLDAIVRELVIFRKGEGHPTVARMSGLFYLNEALGEGIPERAFTALERLYERYGTDPESAIGAYFYLAGWGVGLDSVDKRRYRYREEFLRDISTPLRRSKRGMAELAAIIRDGDEKSRPWAVVSIFQSGNSFQPVLDFNMGYESWNAPTVTLCGEEVPIDFHLHGATPSADRFSRRIVLAETALDLDKAFGEQMGSLRVIWPMPVWPVWNLVSWTADPRILTRMRTFRQRAVDVSLEWWSHMPPNESGGLVSDGLIWTERGDFRAMKLPSGWGVR
ncbi:hypothetical protein IFU30_12470 [Plantibacter sp. CFBP 8798]|uniref:hypothetical protein n=1 Tax=Plantibacter sp. CFBP 8798 TaxID=2775268 RepID=UPI001784133F|nr:hypothetical protein [Plantibacter sp. CFBP 8798]MBD8467084.1 hypothetical protein [Plantibacter sp. CFBP 8798]